MILNKTGKIRDGKYADWEIAIQDDSDGTGGYYVIIWSKKDNVGYDDWFENYHQMEEFVAKEYIIEWTDEDYVPRVVDEKTLKNVKEFQSLAKKKVF